MLQDNWLLQAILKLIPKYTDQKRLFDGLHSSNLVLPDERDPVSKKFVADVKVSRKHYVGMIVGKSGKNIREKRDQTNANVQNPHQEEEPIFKVSCDDLEGLLKMCLWILQQDDLQSGRNTDSLDSDPKIEKRVQVCEWYVGLLVGPNGATIKKIKEDSRCNIQSPPRDERAKIFTITGNSEEDVDKAYLLMKEIIEHKPQPENHSCTHCACHTDKLTQPFGGSPTAYPGITQFHQPFGVSPTTTTVHQGKVYEAEGMQYDVQDTPVLQRTPPFPTRQPFDFPPPASPYLASLMTSPYSSTSYSSTSFSSTASMSSPNFNEQQLEAAMEPLYPWPLDELVNKLVEAKRVEDQYELRMRNRCYTSLCSPSALPITETFQQNLPVWGAFQGSMTRGENQEYRGNHHF